MNVLMQIRTDAFTKYGGDTNQMLHYKKHLESLGVHVDISTCLRPNLASYDMVHLSNLDRPLETFTQLCNAKRQGRRAVLSPIHQSFQYREDFRRFHDTGLIGWVGRKCRKREHFEVAKDALRCLQNFDLLGAWLREAWVGPIEAQRHIVELADAIILLANAEGRQIERDLGLTLDRTYTVYNGVDCIGKGPGELDERGSEIYRDCVLVVGRIETGKNPLGIARVLAETPFKIVFVGGINPWHRVYFKDFKHFIEKHDNLQYLGRLQPEQVAMAFALSTVHVNASWFEVAPLVDIEAAYWGCKVVTTTRSYAREYISEFALFCDPADPKSIRSAVLEAYSRPKNPEVRKIIADRFSWRRAARSLVDAYKEVMDRKALQQ
ncbi:MAG: glycosyltransferase family 4 protein [Candidatus Hydrogenedentota bacterium]|nr:MAG: glycosyltransferase family 4 protein [Candidatus Hydrogenedentota bacterium]